MSRASGTTGRTRTTRSKERPFWLVKADQIKSLEQYGSVTMEVEPVADEYGYIVLRGNGVTG